MKAAWPVALAILLGGCALPPAFQMATLLADVFSYVASGKSVTDHGISLAVRKDCAMLRVVQGEELCRENGPVTMIANASSDDGAEGVAVAGDGADKTAVVAQVGPPAVEWPGRP